MLTDYAGNEAEKDKDKHLNELVSPCFSLVTQIVHFSITLLKLQVQYVNCRQRVGLHVNPLFTFSACICFSLLLIHERWSLYALSSKIFS